MVTSAQKLNAQLATIALLAAAACCIKPTSAIFNCLSPNAFKMKHAPFAINPYSGAERTNWYPQQTAYGQSPQHQTPSPSYYHQSPIKSLFAPKWKPSLFGAGANKIGGWPGWRMGALNRPPQFSSGFSYGNSFQMPGYALPEQLNIAPMALPASSLSELGWSTPVNNYDQTQQTQLSYYDKPTTNYGQQQYDGSSSTSGSQQFSPSSSRPQGTSFDPYFGSQPQQLNPQQQQILPPQGTKTPPPSGKPQQGQQQSTKK